ncbi:unnamed protein product [Sphenostylis stenocarpa]|uniref:Uncharacterized protein n=1 Tax=Sphenostylis stenocarpa TaxID=92480 RepID=A0AA86W4D8_9FABA|nr:unnamed protein product [Sphenostylis stenocarpa]
MERRKARCVWVFHMKQRTHSGAFIVRYRVCEPDLALKLGLREFEFESCGMRKPELAYAKHEVHPQP